MRLRKPRLLIKSLIDFTLCNKKKILIYCGVISRIAYEEMIKIWQGIKITLSRKRNVGVKNIKVEDVEVKKLE